MPSTSKSKKLTARAKHLAMGTELAPPTPPGIPAPGGRLSNVGPAQRPPSPQRPAMSQNRAPAIEPREDVDEVEEKTDVRLMRPAGLSEDPPESERRSSSLESNPSEPPPEAAAEGSNDSMLSRYFRDMATHQVMGPDEELQTAQAVEQARGRALGGAARLPAGAPRLSSTSSIGTS